MQSATSPRQTRRTPLLRGALITLGVLMGLAVAEGGLRLYLKVTGKPAPDMGGVAREIQTILEGMTGLAEGVTLDRSGPVRPSKALYMLHPYAGFMPRVGAKRLIDCAAWFSGAESEDTYDVFLFGGSVAAGFSSNGVEDLLAAVEASPESSGKPIRFESFAVPAHKQPQQLLILTYLYSLGARPDLVINLDGLNELRIGRVNGSRGLATSFPAVGHWSSLAGEDLASSPAVLDQLLEIRRIQSEAATLGHRALENGWCNSAVVGLTVHSRLRSARAEWARAQAALEELLAQDQGQSGQPGYGPRLGVKDSLEAALKCWRESSLAMHELCTARGARYLHLLQPTLHDEGSKPVTDKEHSVGIGANGLDQSVVSGYPRMREGLAALAARGVEALDTSDAFAGVDETIYVDSCHFGRRGGQLLAQRVIELLDLQGSGPADGRDSPGR